MASGWTAGWTGGLAIRRGASRKSLPWAGPGDARGAGPLGSLQEAVQLLLNAGKRVPPQVIHAPLLPLSALLLGTRRLHLLLDGQRGDGDGQGDLRNTSPRETAQKNCPRTLSHTPGVCPDWHSVPQTHGSGGTTALLTTADLRFRRKHAE